MQLRIKSNIAVSDTGFVFNPGTGDSYSINPIGVEIIRWMKAAQSEAEIINKLVEQYDTDNQTVEKDLYDFYNMLLQNQLAEKL
jgi:Coenzyme PQQ synthesis protein D (PqqD)